jgi:hypothetical protein
MSRHTLRKDLRRFAPLDQNNTIKKLGVDRNDELDQ